jgi:hypothetical protein
LDGTERFILELITFARYIPRQEPTALAISDQKDGDDQKLPSSNSLRIAGMVALKRFLSPLETRKDSGEFTMTISKECTDFLRDHHMTSYGQKLKATHAREIVAAFFGYKSHAAQLAETQFPLSEIEVANILAPDVPRIEWRIAHLNGLPSNLPEAYELARVLGEFLVRQDLFQGRIWLYDSLGNYVVEELLQENHSFIEDEMSGEMASTNAIFDEYPEYDDYGH